MNKKLQKQIESKLDQFQTLLDNIEEARHLDSNDPDTWDGDTLYSLVEELNSALALLEDKKTNEHNEPGLCSLIDDWENQQEEEEDA